MVWRAADRHSLGLGTIDMPAHDLATAFWAVHDSLSWAHPEVLRVYAALRELQRQIIAAELLVRHPVRSAAATCAGHVATDSMQQRARNRRRPCCTRNTAWNQVRHAEALSLEDFSIGYEAQRQLSADLSITRHVEAMAEALASALGDQRDDAARELLRPRLSKLATLTNLQVPRLPGLHSLLRCRAVCPVLHRVRCMMPASCLAPLLMRCISSVARCVFSVAWAHVVRAAG
jgi:hypothetical protein